MLRPISLLLSLLAGLTAACTAPTHRLPLHIADGHTPLVAMTINDHLVREFVLDTGASNTTVHPVDAQRLGLVKLGNDVGVGSTGSVGLTTYQVKSLSVAGYRRTGLTVAAIEGPTFTGRRVTGLAGVDLLEAKIVDFNFPAQRATVHAVSPKFDTSWFLIQSQWIRPWKIMIPVRLNGVAAMAFLDTGAQISVANAALARAAGLTPLSEGQALTGLSGDAGQLTTAPFAAMQIGPWNLAAGKIAVADLPLFHRLLGTDSPQLILGMDLMINRRLVIDYKDQRVLLYAAN